VPENGDMEHSYVLPPAHLLWASLARRLLHPVQVEAIEALRLSNQPLSARELAEVIEGAKADGLAHHHLRRLRTLGAIAVAKGPRSCDPTKIRYRLVTEPADGEGPD
jgi:predicted transcriptional regulator